MTKAQTLRIFATLATILLLAGSAYAVGISESADGLAWNIEKAHAGSTVSISGPDGFTFSKTFDGASSPFVSLYDKAGYLWADGQYSWQLTLHADAKVRGEDAAIGLDDNVFSGSFAIKNGSLITAKPSKIDSDRPLNKDQVIADDLIVQFSACVGNDCNNGEIFGFDTIRLKENNLRIKFEDTSVGSFPSNDWELTANDSSNGGQNRFSITDITGGRTPFTIEAPAPSNSLYVDDNGRVGLGTSTPVVELHVVNGDSPALRLEQSGASGFTPQTWDLAGNETNFFVRDVTNGSRLPFKIIPSAPTNSLYVAADGDIGMGTASPAAPLDIVEATGADASLLQLTNDAGSRIQLEDSSNDTNDWLIATSAGNFRITEIGSGGTELEVSNTGVLSVRSACMEFNTGGSTIACTAAAGSFSCVAGNC